MITSGAKHHDRVEMQMPAAADKIENVKMRKCENAKG